MDTLSITCPTVFCVVAHHNQTTCASSVMLRESSSGRTANTRQTFSANPSQVVFPRAHPQGCTADPVGRWCGLFSPSLAGHRHHTQKHCVLTKLGIQGFRELSFIVENGYTGLLALQSWEQGDLFPRRDRGKLEECKAWVCTQNGMTGDGWSLPSCQQQGELACKNMVPWRSVMLYSPSLTKEVLKPSLS